MLVCARACFLPPFRFFPGCHVLLMSWSTVALSLLSSSFTHTLSLDEKWLLCEICAITLSASAGLVDRICLYMSTHEWNLLRARLTPFTLS